MYTGEYNKENFQKIIKAVPSQQEEAMKVFKDIQERLLGYFPNNDELSKASREDFKEAEEEISAFMETEFEQQCFDFILNNIGFDGLIGNSREEDEIKLNNALKKVCELQKTQDLPDKRIEDNKLTNKRIKIPNIAAPSITRKSLKPEAIKQRQEEGRKIGFNRSIGGSNTSNNNND